VVGIGPIGRIGPIRLGGWLRSFSRGSTQHVVRSNRWPCGTEKRGDGRSADGRGRENRDGRALQAGILRNLGNGAGNEDGRETGTKTAVLWGVFWQVTPTRLIELINDPDRERARRAMEAMMKTVKIDIAELERAVQAAEEQAENT
jgi:hypothetical protein